jgi:hypothetical protein
MELIKTADLKASKKIKELIDALQQRLLLTEDALEDLTRCAEITEITGQTEMLSTFIAQANTFLEDRAVRPDSSISADQNKITIITNEETENKNVVSW